MIKLSIIDFYSTFCSPCKKMAKDLDSLSESLPIDVKKINIEEEFALVEKYQVMSVPTLVVLKNGEQVGTYIGYKGISDLEGFLKKHI